MNRKQHTRRLLGIKAGVEERRRRNKAIRVLADQHIAAENAAWLRVMKEQQRIEDERQAHLAALASDEATELEIETLLKDLPSTAGSW